MSTETGMRVNRWTTWMIAAGCAFSLPVATVAESLPSALAGSWRIQRVLPTSNAGCWSTEQAHELVGSTLVYAQGSMRWHGGEVPLEGISTREITATQFQKENGGSAGSADFAQLGIRSPRVLEIDLQHEDMDITGATTEVPGDSVLIASPNRIVVSACGVYMEATRANGSLQRTSVRR